MNNLKTLLARLHRRYLPAFLLACGLTVAGASAATINVSTLTQFTAALTNVQPGDTILLSGTIDTGGTKLSTTKNGTSSAPITITGDGTAVIQSRANYALEILHDYYRLSNFRIQGVAGSTSNSPNKGIVIDSADHGVVENVHVRYTDQEAFKVRNQSKYWLFAFCSARDTGLQNDYGEGFYVGQAASNWIGNTPDASGYITFFNCYTINTYNDGWDIKEGAHHIKMVNCTADYSGSVEPPFDHPRGSDGWYIRADNIQVIKCSVKDLGNTEAAYRFSNQTVDGIDYGSSGNEIKQSAVIGGNGALIFSEGGTNGRVYTDCVPGPGGLLDSGTSAGSITQPSPSTFTEMTWSGEGGGIYGNLDADIGAPDPLGTPPPPTVVAPAFNPAGGTYSTAQNVTITSGTSGATIRYTTNGTNPTATSGAVYSGPVAISATTTLKAIAYKSGMTNSSVTSATYTISTVPSQVAAPSFSPGGGTYSTTQNVTITSATSGATIRYTTNGTNPTATSGTVYSGPVTISATTTLRAIAYKSGMTDSAVTSATYTIGGGTSQSQVATMTSSGDDAKERTDGTSGYVNLTSSLPFGNDGSTYAVGVRFPGVNIPAGATVTAAYIQFRSHSSDTVTTNLTIKGHKTTNAPVFTTAAFNLTSRPKTTATVTWSPSAWVSGDRGVAQRTPSLTTILQEIVGQSGWAAGNAVAFIIQGTGDRTAKAFDSGAANAATLHIEWQ